METLDLKELSRAVGISVRKLRYVVDHKILPGTKNLSKGTRITRHLTQLEAFCIALAAQLLEAGIRREKIAQLMEILCDPAHSPRPAGGPLAQAYGGNGRAYIELAQGEYVRLIIEGTYLPANLPWFSLTTGLRVDAPKDPLIFTTVHLDPLRKALSNAIRKKP